MVITNGSFDTNLSGWTTSGNGNYDVIWESSGPTPGRSRLRIYQCSNAYIEQTFVIDADTLMFDWQTFSDNWSEYPGWELIIGGITVITEGLPTPRAGGLSGAKTVDTSAYIGQTATIKFRVIQSQFCTNSDHANTYLWIDNITLTNTTTGVLNISSTPPGAEIWLAPTGQTLVDRGVVTVQGGTIILGLLGGPYDYKLTFVGYYDTTGSFTITPGYTTTLNISLTPLSCPISPKYSGDTVTLKATPKDGIGPYYVVFRKGGVTIDPSRLGSLSNPILNAPENVDIIRTYTLGDLDISSALTGTIDFSVYMEDSCPTGAKTCIDTCIITIGCVAPVCNFTVT